MMLSKNSAGFVLLQLCFAIGLSTFLFPICILTFGHIQNKTLTVIKQIQEKSELLYIETTIRNEFSESTGVASSPQTLSGFNSAAESLTLSFSGGKLKLKRGSASAQDLNHILGISSINIQKINSKCLDIQLGLSHSTKKLRLGLINESL